MKLSPDQESPLKSLKKRWWWVNHQTSSASLWWEIIRRNKYWISQYHLQLHADKAAGRLKEIINKEYELVKRLRKKQLVTKQQVSEVLNKKSKAQQKLDLIEKQLSQFKGIEEHSFFETILKHCDPSYTWQELKNKVSREKAASLQSLETEYKNLPIRLGKRFTRNTPVRSWGLPLLIGGWAHTRLQGESFRKFVRRNEGSIPQRLEKWSRAELVDWIVRAHQEQDGKLLFSVENGTRKSTASKKFQELLQEFDLWPIIDKKYNPSTFDVWSRLKMWDCQKDGLKLKKISDLFSGADLGSISRRAKAMDKVITSYYSVGKH